MKLSFCLVGQYDAVLYLGNAADDADSLVIQLLLSGTPTEFLSQRKSPEGSRLFESPLAHPKSAGVISKSLVVDEVKSELCEAIAAKALEVRYPPCFQKVRVVLSYPLVAALHPAFGN